MNGGPSHVDTFDPKPTLDPVPRQALALEPPHRAEDRRRVRLAVQVPEVRPERHRGQRAVRQHGRVIDDICVIRSMHADVPNHEPSLMLMNCGDARQARPSVGSWVLYGLGTENQNLPGFVVMCPGGFPIAESQNWQAGFPAGHLPGNVHRQPAHRDREADRAHQEPSSARARPARAARPPRRAERRHLRTPPARGRARGAHPVVRAGLPDAVGGRRRLRRHPGAASRSARCMARASRPGNS